MKNVVDGKEDVETKVVDPSEEAVRVLGAYVADIDKQEFVVRVLEAALELACNYEIVKMYLDECFSDPVAFNEIWKKPIDQNRLITDLESYMHVVQADIKMTLRAETSYMHKRLQTLNDIYLSHARDTTMTGQCYEDIQFATEALKRFLEQFEDTMMEEC